MTAALLLALTLLQPEPAAATTAPPDPVAAAGAPSAPSDAPVTAAAPAAGEAPSDAKPPEPKSDDAKRAEPAGGARPAEAPAAEAKPPAEPTPTAPGTEGVAAAKEQAGEPAPAAPASAAAEPPPPAPASDPYAPAAPAGAPGSPPVCVSPEPTPDVAEPGLALVGYSFGIGFPQFGNANVVVRPLRWLRADAGVTWNYVGWGLRGEVTWAPLRWYVSPTLNLAYGRYLKMDATRAGKLPAEVQGLASKIGYQYLDATLGIELGNQRHGMLVLQLGVTRLWIDAPGTATFDARAAGSGTTTTTTVEATGVSVRGWGPAASLSWIIFL